MPKSKLYKPYVSEKRKKKAETIIAERRSDLERKWLAENGYKPIIKSRNAFDMDWGGGYKEQI